MSLAGFADYLGFSGEDELSDEQVRCFFAATDLVDGALQGARPVTHWVLDQMVYDVAADLAKRSQSTSGQYDGTDGNRAPNDPLNRVRAIIKRYTVKGI